MYAIRKSSEETVFSANKPSDSIVKGLVKRHGADAEVYRLTSDDSFIACQTILHQPEDGHTDEDPKPSTKRLDLAADNSAIRVLSETDEVLGSWPTEPYPLS